MAYYVDKMRKANLKIMKKGLLKLVQRSNDQAIFQLLGCLMTFNDEK